MFWSTKLLVGNEAILVFVFVVKDIADHVVVGRFIGGIHSRNLLLLSDEIRNLKDKMGRIVTQSDVNLRVVLIH